MDLVRHTRRLRPGFVILMMSCLVFFILGFEAAGGLGRPAPQTAPGLSAASIQVEMPREPKAVEEVTDWRLILVNAEQPLPDDYEISFTQLRNNQQVDERMYPDLQEMMDAARAEGLSPLICSSYRSAWQQRELYQAKVLEYTDQGFAQAEAEELAAQWVAPPGSSEHQTGLAVDIVAESYQHLDEEQEDTAEQRWLLEHCWEYGFILRYPEDKAHRTGIRYEPWHYRYVGVEAALAMRSSGQCLEEYLDEIS